MGKCEIIDNIKTIIQENCINQNGKVKPPSSKKLWWITRGFPEAYQEIVNLTSFLPDDVRYATRIHCILNDITERPGCKTCGNDTKYSADLKGYRDYCSSTCATRSPEIRDKVKATNLEKYGCEFPLAKHVTSEELKLKNLEKYGCEFFVQTKEFREKTTNTSQKKYGTNQPIQSVEVKENWKNSLEKKYGVRHPKHINLSKKLINISYEMIQELYEEHIKDKIPVYVLSEREGFSTHHLSGLFVKNGFTPKRFPISELQKSLQEKLEKDYLVCSCDRTILKPYEIDIYFPDYNFGIEVDGIFWHSVFSSMVDNSHFDKINLAHERGIDLVRFNEIELTKSFDICRSIIGSRLGENTRIFARKCQLVKVNKEEERDFLINNHIQGYVASKAAYGLTYNGELVHLTTFGKPRFNKAFQWEILRSCSLLNTTVVGGFTKTFSSFIKEYRPNTIITYADRRYFTGKSYLHSEFQFSHVTKPGYYYYKDFIIYNRQKFQKHKQQIVLDLFDENKTEKENMIANGYRIYYDCGQNVYVWGSVK